MVAPSVALVIATACGVMYVPAAGVNVGIAADDASVTVPEALMVAVVSPFFAVMLPEYVPSARSAFILA